MDELLEMWISYSADYEYMTSCNSVAYVNVSEEHADSIFRIEVLYSSTLKLENLGSMI
jgi:hypothetical protein